MNAPAASAPRHDARLVVRDVYGDIHYVSAEDFRSGRTQLHRYTSTGRRLSDYYETMGWSGRPTTLHRDNVAEILTETPA